MNLRNVVLATEYGPMIVNRHDKNQANALFKTGRAPDHDEVVFLRNLLRADAIVVDAGACFGAYTLALAPLCQVVVAFEPQRALFNCLAGSVALGGWDNIFVYQQALGDRSGLIELPEYEYDRPMNFGSVEFGHPQQEKLDQEPKPGGTVPIDRLDALRLPWLDLLKIDVEGMEAEVICGAHDTIARCRPLIYIEWLKSERDRLISLLVQHHNYRLEDRPGHNWLALPQQE